MNSTPFPLAPALSPREREEGRQRVEMDVAHRQFDSEAFGLGMQQRVEPAQCRQEDAQPREGASFGAARPSKASILTHGGRSTHPLPEGEGRGEGESRIRSLTHATARGDLTRTPASTSRITLELPTNSRWFTRFFAAYSERLVRKNFHAVRLLGAPDLSAVAGRPLVIYANHPSWWDPLIGLVVWRRLLGDRTPYAPIEAAMLKKYAFFKRLGFFGVDKQSLVGARRFLRVGRELLARPDTLLLITPQGRFADVRDAAAGFEPGLAHLAATAPDAVYLPLAIEIAFWEEKRPEVLLRFGKPVFPSSDRASDMNARLEAALHEASTRLAEASIRREVEAFQNLLTGGSGTQPVYDGWRWLKARWRGETFDPAHGGK